MKKPNEVIHELVLGLLKGEDSKKLDENAINGLISGTFDKSLIDGRSMIAKLAKNGTVQTFVDRIKEKSHAGTSSVEYRSYEKSEIKHNFPMLKNKFDSLCDFLDSDDCEIFGKDEIKTTLATENLRNFMIENKCSVISPILAYVVAQKVAKASGIVETEITETEIIETEKSIEPIIVGLFEAGKLNKDLHVHTKELKKEICDLATEILENSGAQKANAESLVKEFFHDLVMTAYLNDSPKPESIHMGLDNEKLAKMMYVSADGISTPFFENPKFLTKRPDISEKAYLTWIFKPLLDDYDRSKLYTIMKLTQEKILPGTLDDKTGKSKSAFADPENALKLFVSTAVLCDQFPEIVDEDMAFAIANPLIDLVRVVESDKVKDVVKEGIEIAKTFAETMGNTSAITAIQGYLDSLSPAATAPKTTRKPATPKAPAAAKKATPSADKEAKKTNAALQLAMVEMVVS